MGYLKYVSSVLIMMGKVGGRVLGEMEHSPSKQTSRRPLVRKLVAQSAEDIIVPVE